MEDFSKQKQIANVLRYVRTYMHCKEMLHQLVVASLTAERLTKYVYMYWLRFLP